MCYLTLGVVAILELSLGTSSSDQQGYSRELQVIPNGGEEAIARFVSDQMEPRHAVVVVTAGKGTKRHKLLQTIAEDGEELHFLVAIGIQFKKGSSIVMHHYRYPALTYDGKWTPSAVRDWLKSSAYPLVNRMSTQFAPPKYLTTSSFGVVLIVKDLSAQTDQLVKTLEVYADRYRDTLKFTFFTKSPGTAEICQWYGIWSNDEILVIAKPSEVWRGGHSSRPLAPNFRQEGVTSASIERFFDDYANAALPPYFKSSFPRRTPGVFVTKDGIRELSGWDFSEVVNEPSNAVMVEFVSSGCDSCLDFETTYKDLALRVVQARRKDKHAFRNLTIARMNQSAHQHPERIQGTPWIRFWRLGAARKSVDVEARSVAGLLEFLEDNLAEEAQSHGVQGGSKSSDAMSSAEPDETATPQRSSEKLEIRLPQPVPEAARSYLRTDEEPPDMDESDMIAASRGYLTTEL